MIKQLEPPSFFNIVTFTIGVNNWSIFVKKLKDLYIEHVQNLNIIYIYIYCKRPIMAFSSLQKD